MPEETIAWDVQVTWRENDARYAHPLEYGLKVETHPTEQIAWAAGRRRAGEIKAKRGEEVVFDLEVLVTPRKRQSIRLKP